MQLPGDEEVLYYQGVRRCNYLAMRRCYTVYMLPGGKKVHIPRNEEVLLPGDEEVLYYQFVRRCYYLEMRRCEVRRLFSVMMAIPPLVERCSRLPF